jgi:hypothetical protein
LLQFSPLLEHSLHGDAGTAAAARSGGSGGRKLAEGAPLPRRLLDNLAAGTAIGVEVILAPGVAAAGGGDGGGDGVEARARALVERWLAELGDAPAVRFSRIRL